MISALCGENWMFPSPVCSTEYKQRSAKVNQKEFACHLLLPYNALYKGVGKHDVFLYP
jgi:hypothetical protein